MSVRIIPRLEIKGTNLVKGRSFEGLRVLGKAWDYARLYYEEGADEIAYQDAVASLYSRNSILENVQSTSATVHIPLTVAGGIRSLSDIAEALSKGADKVSINTAAIEQPDLIDQAAKSFGSSTIVATIEASWNAQSRVWQAMYNFGRDRSDKKVLDWARELEQRGAGELNVIVVDRDGWANGLEIDLASDISQLVKIPIIFGGGAGTKEQVAELFLNSNVSAVSIGTAFHYHYLKSILNHFQQQEYAQEGNTTYITSLKTGGALMGFGIRELKEYLRSRSIPVSMRYE